MKKLRISTKLNLHNCPEDKFSKCIKQGLILLKNAGFDAADFSTDMLVDIEGDWTPYIEKTKKASVETEMKIEICHLPFSWTICTRPEEIPSFNKKMYKGIDAAALLGVDYAVLHPNTTTLPMTEFDRKVQYKSVTEHLAPFVEYASKLNVKLAVENMRLVHSHIPVHRYCQDPDELCEVADALGIGVCWDFGHANTCSIKQSEALSYIGSRLKVLHVNDNNGIGDDHVAPFCGTIDWKDAMKGLFDIGFDGLFNYEIEIAKLPEAVKDAYARYLVACAHEMMTY
ncbi:MAG: sugar phosphate isomerase/epimerase [Ruminococcaceae bacterium]|nr:sugar phosphate isomerase/epimerase [Oscillospiraceae bacterium]